MYGKKRPVQGVFFIAKMHILSENGVSFSGNPKKMTKKYKNSFAYIYFSFFI